MNDFIRTYLQEGEKVLQLNRFTNTTVMKIKEYFVSFVILSAILTNVNSKHHRLNALADSRLNEWGVRWSSSQGSERSRMIEDDDLQRAYEDSILLQDLFSDYE
ncbi:uncharacterized protein LOC120330313 [Styela clava]